MRGQGAARLLIEAVAADGARQRGCPRYYWLTQQHNVRARGLYDKVARFAGFIRYDYPLNVPSLDQSGVTPKRRCQNSRLRRSPMSQPSSYSGRTKLV